MEKVTGNVFRSFAARSLKANRTRTIVTIIGIVLSMALFTAVIEGAYSGMRFLIDSETEAEGPWIGEFYDITEENYEELSGSEELADTAYFRTLGWASAYKDEEDLKYMKPYLLIESVSDNFEELVAVHIKEGRLPENEKEIIIPGHLYDNGCVSYNVGDKLTVEVGDRYQGSAQLGSRDEVLELSEESLQNVKKTEYTIVGIYDRFNYRIESYDCPAYMLLTRDGAGSSIVGNENAESGTFGNEDVNGNIEDEAGTLKMTESYTAFFTMKNLKNYYSFLKSQTIVSDNFETHSDLLYYNGVSSNTGIMTFMAGMVIILILLIVIGSITLIYNSFSISVSERTKQFGILKSVGATKKQLRTAVLYEAFILAGFGIVIGAVVGCAGIGLTLYFLSDTFTGLLTYSGDVKMQLVINPIALIIAAVICLVTVLISAWIPAGRAMRVSAIEAIRQSSDVKIKGKKVKTSKLTQKLFGIEGTLAAKNFKRNKKKCRSVVLSLTLSIILFISASSFCAYLVDSVDSYSSADMGYDIDATLTYPYPQTEKYEEAILQDIKDIKGVDQAVYASWFISPVIYAGSFVSDESLQFAPVKYLDEDSFAIDTSIVFVNDEEFIRLCREKGLDADEYFDKNEPLGIMQSDMTFYSYDAEAGYTKYYSFDFLKNGANISEAAIYFGKNIEGEIFDRIDVSDGQIHALYLDDSESDYNRELVELPLEKAAIRRSLKIGAVLDNAGGFVSNSVPAIIYPYSMMESVIVKGAAEENLIGSATYYVTTGSHEAVTKAIEKYADDNEIGMSVYDVAASYEAVRMLVMIINVFAYGFIILISLIAVANVFNTISTNVGLRRREFAMLRSMGLSGRGFRKMMNYECIIYGIRGVIWGLPISIIITFLVYKAVGASRETSFYIPWHSLAIAIGSVFLVVFLAMWYSAGKIKKDNTIDALKNENL